MSPTSPPCISLCSDAQATSGALRKRGDGNADISEEVAWTAELQGAQDAKAAVRFFRDPAAAKLYGIDSAKIFLGGISAGAFVSGMAVYLDDLSKADAALKKIIAANGGLEGKSGNPGNDSSVSAWVCLSGGLNDKTWITTSSPALLGVYGTADDLVPAGDGTGPAGDPVSGAVSLYDQAKSVGLPTSQLYAVEGGGHADYFDRPDVINSIVQFITPGAPPVTTTSNPSSQGPPPRLL